MTKHERQQRLNMFTELQSLGFTYAEFEALRRISKTLHRWHELECGNSNTYGSWAIERDENGEGPPFMIHHHYAHGHGKDTVTRTRIPDHEAGAKKRLAAIVDQCNNARRTATADGKLAPKEPLSYFIQTDPRGAALYILRPGDVPADADVNAYYTRGICVF